MSHLLTYLQQVQKLEMDRYVCEKAREGYHKSLDAKKESIQPIPDSLNHRSPTVEAKRHEILKLNHELISKKSCLEKSKDTHQEGNLGCGFGIIISIALYFIMFLIYDGTDAWNGSKLIISVVAGIVSAILISILDALVFNPLYQKKSEAKFNKLETEINAKIKKIEDEIKEEETPQIKDLQKSVIESNNRILHLIEKEEQNIARTNEMINQIDIALNTAYSVGIIPQKYRSLVPVTMFCEYIENGRCETLSGHEGAINLYENELRQNIIINKLDSIRSGISSLADNQFRLYQSLTSANSKIANLTSAYNTQNAIISHNASVAQHQTDMLLSIERDKLDAIKRIEPLLGG